MLLTVTTVLKLFYASFLFKLNRGEKKGVYRVTVCILGVIIKFLNTVYYISDTSAFQTVTAFILIILAEINLIQSHFN